MRELDIVFEENPWEQELNRLQQGDSMSALRALALTQADEETLLEELTQLEERGITLDISELPREGSAGQAAVRLRQEEQLSQGDDLVAGLGENDPLRLYLEELSGVPAQGDCKVFAQEHLAGKDRAEQLVNLSLSRVVELAKEYTGYGVLLMDLIQEGSLGLWQGVLQYTGGDFEDHRDWWIRQYLAKAVVVQSRTGDLGQKLRQGMEDYRDVDQRLLGELGRTPTLEEIAEGMHITVDKAQVFANMQTQARTRQQIDATREPVEPTQDDEQAVENTAYFQMRQRILELLSTLSEEDARLLTLRYGLEGGLPLSPQDVGKHLGLTDQEVLQREAAALMQLRKGE